jgi:photosystem II stability/assembly factor-like uncharacterized protein
VNGTVGAAIIVDPFDPRTVWLGTGGENDEIWRSDDCAATWTRVNTGPGSVGDNATYGGVGDGAQWSMQADPVARGVLYAVSGYGAQSLWKTTDGGYSWSDVLAGTEYESHAEYRFVNNVSLDPTDHQHLVVSTHGACLPPYAPSCIAETKDGGSSWRVLSAPEGWAEGGGLIHYRRKCRVSARLLPSAATRFMAAIHIRMWVIPMSLNANRTCETPKKTIPR